MSQPMQPLYVDESGVIRFQENAIVSWLLDKGGLTLNDIAMQQFSREDHEQFAQLIVYSHSGSGDLSYVSDEVWEAAMEVHHSGGDPWQVRAAILRDRLQSLKDGLRRPIAELYGRHEDDLA